MQRFGMQATGRDQVGFLPEVGAPAVMTADTLLITVPTTMGLDVNVRILDNFAKHVTPELGWTPQR